MTKWIFLFFMLMSGISNAWASDIRLSDYTETLYRNLQLESKGLDFAPFRLALIGYFNLMGRHDIDDRGIITVIDFKKSANTKRLFMVSLKDRSILFNTYVAHGKNSGEEFATRFSNIPESNTSSMGFYKTDDLYTGAHGLSLHVDGLDVGFNDNARDRAIVVHGADYVSEAFIAQYGRLGRSFGCPAIPMNYVQTLIPAMAQGTLMFAYYPDNQYLSTGLFLDEEGAEIIFQNDSSYH